MRISVGLLLASFTVAALTAGPPAEAQQGSASSNKGSDIVTLSGCVSADPKAGKVFTLADATQDQTYRLTGVDVRGFVGQHVEVLGAKPRRFVVKMGLYPNANVAAQAGDMDPTKAAMAAQSGPTSNSPQPLVEFKVKSVRITPGVCPGQ